MKILTGGRGFGKTIRMINESAKTGATIVCFNGQEAFRVERIAREMGVVIPKVWAMQPMLDGRGRGKEPSKVILDNVDLMLRELFGPHSRIHIVTLTPDSLEVLPQPEGMK